MKTVRKKRSKWQIFLWGLRHPLMYSRAVALQDIHRKRILREYIEWDYKENKKEYDRMFREELRRERRKPRRIQLGPNYYELPPDPW